MVYQDRADIDELIRAVDDLKYFTRLDEKEQLATLEDINKLSSDLIEKYYDKSECYNKDEVDTALNGKANSSHAHGKITNAGTVTSVDTTAMNYFAGFDSSNRIVRANTLYNSKVIDSQSDTYTNIGSLADNSTQKVINKAIDTKFGSCITEQYTHPSTKQCNYAYEHPQTKQCNYQYVHPQQVQCGVDSSIPLSSDMIDYLSGMGITGVNTVDELFGYLMNNM